MTVLEDRLRGDLVDLADAMLDRVDVAPPGTVDDGPPVLPGPLPASTSVRSSARGRLIGVAATVLLLGAVALAVVVRNDDVGPVAKVPVTDGPAFGRWEPLPPAPISARAYPVAGWTGEEVVIWAGGNLPGTFAEVDGAAFDPAHRAWREIDGPGWGHPGMTGAVHGGELYSLAKGSGVRFDAESEEWTELPRVDGMWFGAVVATDEDVWGLGPAAQNAEGQPDLAIARYDADGDRWEVGPSLEGTDHRGVADAVAGRRHASLWTGSEILVWTADGTVSAFDPAAGTWRVFPRLRHPDGPLVETALVHTDEGLVALAQAGTAPSGPVSVARFVDGAWEWLDVELPAADLEASTVAPAGEWLAVVRSDQEPVALHVPSGAWHVVDDGPIGGLQAPAVVWTGTELVVWGGVATPTASVPDPAVGATWEPPVSPP